MIVPLLWIIIGMAVVTYVPRMLPLVVFDAKKLPPKLREMLKNVPFAALGALIIPGVFLFNDDWLFGVLGASTAMATAYAGVNLTLVVLSSVLVLFVYSSFF
ncbi:MAG TPA: AzlD domain-containing protein [Bacillales bacterium]|nr:AzlD domain-containing protein [Bacillales bacterium]